MVSVVANNRYQRDLKKIVGADKEDFGLSPAETRNTIPETRGIGFYSELTNSWVGADGTGGANGSSLPGGYELINRPASTSGGWQTGGADGYAGGTTQPYSFDWESAIHYQGVGEYDALDLLSGDADFAMYDAASELNGGNGNLSIRAITGIYDCEDNQPIKIYLNGDDSGPGFPPPDGWDDAETPPITEDPTWQDGFYWKSVWASSTPQTTPLEAAYEIEQGIANREFKELVPFGSPPYTSYTAVFWILPNKTSTQGFGVNRLACPSLTSYPANPEACESEAPLDPFEGQASEWPSDGELYLRYKDGTFQKSQYEGDIPTNWNQTNASALNFCMDGGKFGRLVPSRDGGLVLYETDSYNGQPINGGSWRKYSSTGAYIASGSNSDITQAFAK